MYVNSTNEQWRFSLCTNQLSDWWKSVAYLDSRLPVVTVNPGIYMPRQNFRGKKEQIEWAFISLSVILRCSQN